MRGGGAEIWEPRFVTHGFRFVEVTGFPGKPDLNSIEGRVVNDDLPVAGNFLCSNDLINRIYHNIVWGTRGNYRSIPTDCPQRDERQGWLGDRSEECKGESYLFDIAPLYAKWRQDMADAQRANGSHPRRRASLLADLFRQRHVAEQRHHHSERAWKGNSATAPASRKNYDSAKHGWNTC